MTKTLNYFSLQQSPLRLKINLCISTLLAVADATICPFLSLPLTAIVMGVAVGGQVLAVIFAFAMLEKIRHHQEVATDVAIQTKEQADHPDTNATIAA
jgi:hypothetical protein